MIANVTVLANQLATTVTTFAPGDPKLATSDPNNPTGLFMVIVLNLIILAGGVLLYLRHRRKPGPVDADPTPVVESGAHPSTD